MRRTSFAAGIAAACAFTGSLHAWTWDIVGANAGGQQPEGGAFKIRAPVNDYFASNFGPGGNPMGAANLTQSEAGDILSAVGLTLSSKTLTYFSWADSAGLGYMAIALHNTSATAFTARITGMNWLSGTAGLFSTNALLSTGYGSLSPISVAAGETFLLVMGGYLSGAPQITFNLNTANGPFGVEYLSYNYGAGTYGVRASGNADSTNGSGMNVATYTVPVPAPLWMAGVGILGGLALRRRAVS
jgi:hypothetical protein